MEGRAITIIDNINGEIRRNGMSKEAFCKKLGVERRLYTSWQKKGEIPATKLLKSAKILNCSLDYLTRDVVIDAPVDENA